MNIRIFLLNEAARTGYSPYNPNYESRPQARNGAAINYTIAQEAPKKNIALTDFYSAFGMSDASVMVFAADSHPASQ